MKDKRFTADQNEEMEKDADEVQGLAGTEPAQDSPGDDAVLEQEELYEGLSSDQMPSEKLGKDEA